MVKSSVSVLPPPCPLQTAFPRIPNSTSLKVFGHKWIGAACAKILRRANTRVQMIWHPLGPCLTPGSKNARATNPSEPWFVVAEILFDLLSGTPPGSACRNPLHRDCPNEDMGPSIGSTNPDSLPHLEFSQKPGLKGWHHFFLHT